ncbi:MAG TPA: hypothetical protein VJN21_09420 [Candidatus Acidoferrales bacterium]|nr:hypothetical protein [Candidatus Acidoferrales bacterium]
MASGTPSTSTGPPGRRVTLSIGTLAAFVAVDLLLVATCLFALRQNLNLRTEIAYDEALLTPRTGSVLPPLVGTDWTGAPIAMSYGQDPRPTLVYSFSQGCTHCQQNWRSMRPLQALAPDHLRIAYIDVASENLTSKYLTASGIGQTVLLVRLSPAAETVYDARAVPQFILAGHDGRVQWSHVGELAPSDVSNALKMIEQD